MPKMKTHKGAAKRFQKTGKGKIKCRCVNRGHILEKNTPKQKRQRRHGMTLHANDQAAVDRMLDGN